MDSTTADDDTKLSSSITKQTDVTCKLAEHLISTEAKGSNFVFSPLSMHVGLCMAAAGSSGPTRHQLLGYLNSDSVDDLNSLSSQVATLLLEDAGGGPQISFANGVFLDQSITLNPAFKQILDNQYKAASNHVDFQNKGEKARKEVNEWMEKETKGMIKDLLPPGSVDSQTSLILANAIYFKGVWFDQFEESNTKHRDFFLSNGTSVRAPFMTRWGKEVICTFDGFKVLKLHYKSKYNNRTFSMLIYLPDARDGLPALVEKFGSEPEFIQDSLPKYSVRVGDFWVPKFKIDFNFDAKKALKGQGLDLPFEKSGSGWGVKISSMFHKSSIEVNEMGTEAAAAMPAVVYTYSSRFGRRVEEKVDFVADHPFLFVVREDVSGVVLFLGQLANPLNS